MKIIVLLILCFFLFGCSSDLSPATSSQSEIVTQENLSTDPTETVQEYDPIASLINNMSLEERVGQIFLVRCDSELAVSHIQKYQFGGYLFFSQDFEKDTPDSFRAKIASYQEAANYPMLYAVDEEGGIVTRISRFSAFAPRNFPSPRQNFQSGGLETCLGVQENICRLLQDLRLNVNMGPVCDISTEPNAFLYPRSLGQDAETTASFVSGTVTLMNAYGIGSVLKHFPGYGNNEDTHIGIASDYRSLEDLKANDLIPFSAGIKAGCGAVLVSHTIVHALDSELPASLSPAVHQFLRQEMGFVGVILTDDLMMEAISSQYGIREAAVLAVLAGNDLLCSTDYVAQYEAVLDAVQDGRISEDCLNSAVRRVLQWKMDLGLFG